jgi:hypothetical protein
MFCDEPAANKSRLPQEVQEEADRAARMDAPGDLRYIAPSINLLAPRLMRGGDH